jgi:predicted RNase H-like nuclease (RuvC/YqgF family)
MGKTETIKDRRIDVYVNTIERKKRWTEEAEAADTSLSNFIEQSVEYAIKQGGPDATELGEDAQRIQELEEEVAELQQELKEKKMVIEKLEQEARERRIEPFQNDEFEGQREYDEELVRILKDSDRVTDEDLVRRLDIDRTNTEVMQGLTSQLQRLEQYGLVQSTSKGWRWEG